MEVTRPKLDLSWDGKVRLTNPVSAAKMIGVDRASPLGGLMAWQVFEKVVHRSTSPTITISKLGRIGFNGAASKTLHENGVEYVLLMWDKENRRIGIRRVGKKDSRSYTVHYAKKYAWSGFAAKGFLEHIGLDYSETKTFPGEWDETDSMFVLSLPDASTSEESATKPHSATSTVAKLTPRKSGEHKASAAL